MINPDVIVANLRTLTIRTDWVDDIERAFKEREALQWEVSRLRVLLKAARRSMPVAAECVADNVNRVDYTDREWRSLENATRQIDEELGQ